MPPPLSATAPPSGRHSAWCLHRLRWAIKTDTHSIHLKVRNTMRLANSIRQILHASYAHVPATEAGYPVEKDMHYKVWFPVGLLAAVAVVVCLLGTSIKPLPELDWLSSLAKGGDAGAQLQLGLAYREGRYGLTPDNKTGLYWLNQSADNGNAYAEMVLGKAYAGGEGVEKNTALAEKWWRKAIKGGNTEARALLGDMLIRSGKVQEGNQLLGSEKPQEGNELNVEPL
jgi:hypothetical protein